MAAASCSGPAVSFWVMVVSWVVVEVVAEVPGSGGQRGMLVVVVLIRVIEIDGCGSMCEKIT